MNDKYLGEIEEQDKQEEAYQISIEASYWVIYDSIKFIYDNFDMGYDEFVTWLDKQVEEMK